MVIKSLKKEAIEKIEKAQDLKGLEIIFQQYFGRKGEISQFFEDIRKLPEKERRKTGEELNEIKKEIKRTLEEKRTNLKKRVAEKEKKIDITLPGKKIPIGHLHPITKVLLKCEEIFEKIGFSVVEGPEVETEWYNFDALNIPKEHPVRDAWDTLWLRQNPKESSGESLRATDKIQNPKLLLRTHTSPVQVRYMEKNNPPLRIIVPGRVFRYEDTDPSHEIQFYQLEGLMLDKKISVANFKGIIQNFLKEFFGKDVSMRIRPGYFPFTEPSFEIDIKCIICQGEGCSTCGQTGWIELIPGGIVHPNVLKNSGFNPKNWQGFAFGMGIDRLAMLKYKIDDIRLFYGGDLRFLHQF